MQSQWALGVITTFLANFMWGVLPIYWKQVQMVPPVQILSHRILWSMVFTGLLAIPLNKWHHIKKTFSMKRDIMLILFASVFITMNWGIYIWAVNAGHIVECSIGYYINPLLSAFLGVILFKEKPAVSQKIAFLLAFIGVIILVFHYGNIPWISLMLAGTFAIYGALKKSVSLDAVTGFLLETSFITPFALMYLLFCHYNGTGAFGRLDLAGNLFLMGAGIVTATPLLLLAFGVQRIPLSMVGFIQYVSPTLSLIIGVLLYNELFTPIHLASLVFIWSGFIVFSLSQTGSIKKNLKDGKQLPARNR